MFKPSTRENTGQFSYPLCALIYEMKTIMVLIPHGGSKDLIKVSKTLGTGSSMLRALYKHLRCHPRGFPGGAVVENLPANAGDTGSSPGLGRSHMPRSN